MSEKPYVEIRVILQACLHCFAERALYTQERLSAAIGQLLDRPVVPTLFLRTVMQALALYPRLTGYVINVLFRLIQKQVRPLHPPVPSHYLLTLHSLIRLNHSLAEGEIVRICVVSCSVGVEERGSLGRFHSLLREDPAAELPGSTSVATTTAAIRVHTRAELAHSGPSLRGQLLLCSGR